MDFTQIGWALIAFFMIFAAVAIYRMLAPK
jgi:hypothetical protein